MLFEIDYNQERTRRKKVWSFCRRRNETLRHSDGQEKGRQGIPFGYRLCRGLELCASKVEESELEGRICYGGLDLSSTTDITAFVLVFPLTEDDDRYIVKPWFWISEDNVDIRVKRDHVVSDHENQMSGTLCVRLPWYF